VIIRAKDGNRTTLTFTFAHLHTHKHTHTHTHTHTPKNRDLDRLDAGAKLTLTQAHTDIINCIDGVGGLEGEGAPELVTGGRDGESIHIFIYIHTHTLVSRFLIYHTHTYIYIYTHTHTQAACVCGTCGCRRLSSPLSQGKEKRKETAGR
jgi:hypothetical protein